MRLSEVLKAADLQQAGITLIGTWKTEKHEFAVLAHRSEKVFPFPKLFHLIEDGPANPDPDLDRAEVESIRRRFLGIVRTRESR